MRKADVPLPLTIDVRSGREVVRQDEPYPGAWVVQSGALVMEAVNREGRCLALDLLGRGDLVGGLPEWTAEASVRSLVPSWLVPAGPAAIQRGLARRARRASWVACSLAWDRIADRVADRLDDLATRFGRPVPGGVRVQLPLTQEDLAGLTGATRESVNRALAELAAVGRVVGGASWYVIRRADPGADGRPISPPGASPASRSCNTGPGR